VGHLDKILKLGNPKLYETSEAVRQVELSELKSEIDFLHALILEFRKKYDVGRAIAAPQIGLMKRIICLNTPELKQTIINPTLSDYSEEMMELWDDCMSFPNIHVRLHRHQSCLMTFVDENWKEQVWHLENDMSELMQHEYDHLNGILATQRAIDDKSFRYFI